MSRTLERALAAAAERISNLEQVRKLKVVFIEAVSAECSDREPNHATSRQGCIWTRESGEDLEGFKQRIKAGNEGRNGIVMVRMSYRWL